MQVFAEPAWPSPHCFAPLAAVTVCFAPKTHPLAASARTHPLLLLTYLCDTATMRLVSTEAAPYLEGIPPTRFDPASPLFFLAPRCPRLLFAVVQRVVHCCAVT